MHQLFPEDMAVVASAIYMIATVRGAISHSGELDVAFLVAFIKIFVFCVLNRLNKKMLVNI